MKSSDFKKGDKVRYVPRHVKGDYHHRDCENGVVSSTNDYYVFVKYNDDNYNAPATNPEDLIFQLIYQLT